MDELIPIQRNGVITLYGRIIGLNGKLGQYTVAGHGHVYGPYGMYSEAEKVYKKLTAPKSQNIQSN